MMRLNTTAVALWGCLLANLAWLIWQATTTLDVLQLVTLLVLTLALVAEANTRPTP